MNVKKWLLEKLMQIEFMKNELDVRKRESLTREKKTVESFDWQWRYLAEDGPDEKGAVLLWAPGWREKVDSMIQDELGLTKENLVGKKVLDVGCGQGRWTYGFKKIDCDVLGIDTSPAGIEYARRWGLNTRVLNLFEIANADLAGKFDFVWCWGVIHHTADPKRAFQAIVEAAKPEGFIHCYVYSHPRSRRIKMMRAFLKPFSFPTRRWIIRFWVRVGFYHGSVHEAFDALSPDINKEIPEEEIRNWCKEFGLRYERRYPAWARSSKDIFFNAWRDSGPNHKV